MAMTTTQRTAKHRLAVKERIARLEAALEEICVMVPMAFDGSLAAPMALDAIDDVAKEALNPTTTPKTPE